MHMSAPPYTDDEETELPGNVRADYRAALDTRSVQWQAHGVDEIPCGFFDMVTRKCRHYEYRPGICRDFELGGDACLASRKAAFE